MRFRWGQSSRACRTTRPRAAACVLNYAFRTGTSPRSTLYRELGDLGDVAQACKRNQARVLLTCTYLD